MNFNTAEIVDLFKRSESPESIEQRATADLRVCRSCAFELGERDKFCRRCGICQTASSQSGPASHLPEITVDQPPAPGTSRLPLANQCNSVTGSLLAGITANVAATTAQLDSRLAKRAVSALISIPLWLIIVLMSPFDAYLAAKSIANSN
jgi:hypothetical protein